MCHEAGCSLAHIAYQIASCGCLHADWMARATAAEAENAMLREALRQCAEAPLSGWTIAQGIARAALEENQRG